MTAPESKPIHVALAAIMADVRSLAKDDRNTHFNFNFRGIDATLNALGPAMRTHGVVVLPQVEDITYRDVQTAKGKPSREVTVRVRYRFVGPEGDSLDVVTVGESMDESDKGTAKAMSVAMRIALLQTFALPTDEPDPDAADIRRGTDLGGANLPSLRSAVLDPDISREKLRGIYAGVTGAGLLAAEVPAAAREAGMTTLGDLITARGAALKAAEEQSGKAVQSVRPVAS